MIKYDIFVESLQELPEGEEITVPVRDLTPGIHKYSYKYVRALVSADADRYPEGLLIRFGRGQEYGKPYSMKVLEFVERIPAKYL
ncbi:MAG: phenylphosphate carboxylase subunit gamma [Clostridia bacterium]|nr:phenylphosphate carboxylase subunit gamma [Clostridia bacterium]